MRLFQSVARHSDLATCLWVLTNLPVEQQALLDKLEKIFEEQVVQFLASSVYQLREQSLMALRNYLGYGGKVPESTLSELRNLMNKFKDVNLIQLALRCLEQSLEQGDRMEIEGTIERNPFWEEWEQLGGVKVLSKQLMSASDEVLHLASEILKKYGVLSEN